MPAKSEKQRRFMGAELARTRAGKKTKTSMSEEKLSEFASKSIDVYLRKHDRVTFPCGHEEGSEIGKACTPNMCGAMGSSSTVGRSGTVYTAQPSMGSAPGGGSMGIHATSQPGSGGGSSSSGGATGSGTMTASSPPEGGFRRSVDPIELIDAYLNKQSRHKCGHKKDDPNHLEAA